MTRYRIKVKAHSSVVMVLTITASSPQFLLSRVHLLMHHTADQFASSIQREFSCCTASCLLSEIYSTYTTIYHLSVSHWVDTLC